MFSLFFCPCAKTSESAERTACHVFPVETRDSDKTQWMNRKELQCSNERGGCQKRGRLVPDVLSQRIFSRPDQPPALQARCSCRHTKAHTHTHTHTHTHKPNNIHEAHWAVCKTRARTPSLSKLQLDLSCEDPEGPACHRSPSFITRCRWQGRSLSKHLRGPSGTHFLERSCLVQLTPGNGGWLTTRDAKHRQAATSSNSRVKIPPQVPKRRLQRRTLGFRAQNRCSVWMMRDFFQFYTFVNIRQSAELDMDIWLSCHKIHSSPNFHVNSNYSKNRQTSANENTTFLGEASNLQMCEFETNPIAKP